MARMLRRLFGWGDLDCRDTRDLGSAYLENDLPPQKRSSLQAHLDRCPPCRAFIDTLASTLGILSRLPAVAAPPSFKQSVTQKIQEEARRSDPHS